MPGLRDPLRQRAALPRTATSFCRRVGTGGTCPHGDEPLTLTDLTEEEVIMPIT
jgi:hypothetical protein